MAKKVVFLDRDGTIIEDKVYLNDPEQIHYIEHCFESLKQLKDAGYDFVVVTNQSGIPRGLVKEENLHKIHEIIKADYQKYDVEILSFHYAPHLPDSDHPTRKPGTGMFDEAAKLNDIDFKNSWMIGDRMTDVEAGHRAGMKSIFLKGTEDASESKFKAAEYDCKDLKEAAEFILKNN